MVLDHCGICSLERDNSTVESMTGQQTVTLITTGHLFYLCFWQVFGVKVPGVTVLCDSGLFLQSLFVIRDQLSPEYSFSMVSMS